MKKLFLLLSAVGMIFTACEPANGLDDNNNGNNTEQPGGGNDDVIPTDKIVIKPSTITVEAAANNYIVAVSSPCSWRATTEEDWITLETELGIDGKQQLIFAVKDYWETEPREGKIVVSNSDEGFSAELTVVQKGFAPILEIEDVSTFECDYKGGMKTIAVTTNFDYDITTTADWVTYNKNEDGVQISIGVSKCENNRTAEIKIFSEKYNLEGRTIIITQTPTPCPVGTLLTIDGAKGVVFDFGDTVTKIVSVTETRADWYDARTWCSNYGTGWYLPTLNELEMIYNNKSTINSTLSANGYTTLGTGYHWSSAENYHDTAYGLNFSSGNSYDDYKNYTHDVRAVLAFEN